MLVAVIAVCAVGVTAEAGDVLYRHGDEHLTKEEFLIHLRGCVSSPEELRIDTLVGQAGAALLPHYHDVLIATDNAQIASKCAGALLLLADEPSQYREDIIHVYTKPAFSNRLSTALIGVLDAVGKIEDAPLLLPHLLDKDSHRTRLSAATVLSKIGDNSTLEAIDAMRPEIEQLEKEDMEELSALREKWLARGKTQERADELVESDRLDRERVHREMAEAILWLRKRLEEEAERGAREQRTIAEFNLQGEVEAQPQVPDLQAEPRETKLIDWKSREDDQASSQESGPYPFGIAALIVVLLLIVPGWMLLRKDRGVDDRE